MGGYGVMGGGVVFTPCPMGHTLRHVACSTVKAAVYLLAGKRRVYDSLVGPLMGVPKVARQFLKMAESHVPAAYFP